MTRPPTPFDDPPRRWPWQRGAGRRLVLVVGSAPDSVALRDAELAGLTLAAVNNAWRLRDDFDFVVFPRNFPEENRPPASYPGALVREVNYLKHVAAAGGLLFCGSTMAFNAGYWALRYLDPALLAFFGSDMIYDDGETHFYGNGLADPLRDNVTLRSLEAKSARLFAYGLARGTVVANFSTRPRSRLVFPRLALPAAGEAASLRRSLAEAARSPAARALVSEAKRIARMEARPPFRVDPNDYWGIVDDAEAIAYLDAVDREWLGTVPHIAAISALIGAPAPAV